ncbi:TetR/AcrR family transcriptional regulator [Citricoccus parietis]|uniref:TetR/AcrR family transcriptional regulator n=1 Tax=Citricoccus parietis TaxID=592307 RepID=A0ABV6F3M6_9MICC
MGAEGGKATRADTQRTRELLLDVLGELLESRGLAVSMPELAREAGVSVATVYRHFDDVHDLRQEFYQRTISKLIARLTQLSEEFSGLELFQRMCDDWVLLASQWARAAAFIRSPEGFIERVRHGDPHMGQLYDLLRPVVSGLMTDRVIEERNVDYGVMLWATLFDERVIVDLESGLGWASTSIARRLSATFLDAMQRSR